MATDEIWVYVEYNEGAITDTCYEVFYAASRLAEQKNVTVNALYIGDPNENLLSEVDKLGMEKLYILHHPSLTPYTTDAYVFALAEVIDKKRPLALLMPGSVNCGDFAPRLSARSKLTYVSDCVKLEWANEKTLLMTRNVYHARSHATYAAHEYGTQLVTILPSAFPKAIPNASDTQLQIEMLSISTPENRIRTKVLGWIEADASTVDLAEAKMIVAGGRGAQSAGGFQIVHRLAEAIGASVGASRVATDEGWAPFERQIGQTGKIVAPSLYIACGISGAVHHTMGIKDTEKILSINTDKSAAIFGISDLGLIGDMHEIMPLLIEKIEAYQLSNGQNRRDSSQDVKVVG